MLTEVGQIDRNRSLCAGTVFDVEAMVPSLVIPIIAAPGGMLLNERSCVGSKLATKAVALQRPFVARLHG